MDAIFAAKLASVLFLLLGGAPLPHSGFHGWQQISSGTYLLDRRTIRCTRSQCRGAVLTLSELGIRIAPFDQFGRVRCTMTVDGWNADGTLELHGCESIRR